MGTVTSGAPRMEANQSESKAFEAEGSLLED